VQAYERDTLLPFALRAAGWLTPEEAQAGALIDGPSALGQRAMAGTAVPF
jgi:hypothetical protein